MVPCYVGLADWKPATGSVNGGQQVCNGVSGLAVVPLVETKMLHELVGGGISIGEAVFERQSTKRLNRLNALDRRRYVIGELVQRNRKPRIGVDKAAGIDEGHPECLAQDILSQDVEAVGLSLPQIPDDRANLGIP